jgi:hypothetical protein
MATVSRLAVIQHLVNPSKANAAEVTLLASVISFFAADLTEQGQLHPKSVARLVDGRAVVRGLHIRQSGIGIDVAKSCSLLLMFSFLYLR